MKDDNYIKSMFEAMNALTAGYMPGTYDNDNVYIVNYMSNNAFAQMVTPDYKLRRGITRDPQDKQIKFTNLVDDDDYGFDNSTNDIKGVYRVTDKAHLSEGLSKLFENIGKEVDESFIYECILGDKMYSWDQIEFSDKVEKITPFSDALSIMKESIRNYTLYGKEKADLIHELKYGNKDMATIVKEYKDILS